MNIQVSMNITRDALDDFEGKEDALMGILVKDGKYVGLSMLEEVDKISVDDGEV